MAGDRLLRGCDVATSEDTLGFGPHVEAVRDFLLDADLPLTMSVEAEWGGGKTSFMLQLKEALAEAAKEGAEVRTVWFNAWRHEKADSLWAAFALQFGEELSRQTSRWKRAGVAVRLARARFDWRLGWWAGVRTVAHVLVWAIVLIVAVVVFLTGGSLPAEFWGGYLKLHWLVGAGAATAAWRLYGAARSALGNPFQYNLGKYLRRPDYAGRVAFVEEFHKDFARVVRAYLGAGKGGDGGRVFVFVDDLDRCDAPKAAELLQSLNLMIPLDSGEQAKRVGYVLGIDRPKVAAAVTAKYKDLLPYLSEGRGGEKGDDEDDRATFGYAFIEKFVQIPFWLPVPGEEELIASLTGGQARPVEQRAVGAAWGFRTDRGDPQWRHFVAMAARFLGRNPRRCKQFRSLLVLRARVWCRIEETQYEQGDPEAIWPGQFAKLILINLLRPTVYRALREEPGLLLGLAGRVEGRGGMEGSAGGEPGGEAASSRGAFSGDVRLVELVRWRPEEEALAGQFSLAGFGADKVGRIMAAVPAASREVARAAEKAAVEGEETRDRDEGPAPGHDFSVSVKKVTEDGREFVELDFGGGVTMRLVAVPGGKFIMGSRKDEEGHQDDEQQHKVFISRAFRMGIYPVTQGQYQAVMGRNPSRFRGGDHPVETVSWEAAKTFCDRINERLGEEGGGVVRLPTEAEWEYACRAESESRFCFGDDDSRLGEYAWYDRNSEGTTHPVGGLAPNGRGLYDVHGNVWEWCRDWYASDYGGLERAGDPEGPESGESRVVRGGAWDGGTRFCRSACRYRGHPLSREEVLGFRVVFCVGGAH